MKNILCTLTVAGLFLTGLQAQNGSEFDFWVGEWNLTWQYPDGSQGSGTNNIIKTLDGKVIVENFQVTDSGAYKGFKGTSISVFNPNTKTWNQAWADNQGGYFNFTGTVENGERIFHTTRVNQSGKESLLRMRFYRIEKDSLVWDWEQSTDGGSIWNLQWRINYKRKS